MWSWQIQIYENAILLAKDVAGGGVIHISAGGIAVVAAVLLGPRPGRRDEATGGFKVLGGKTNTVHRHCSFITIIRNLLNMDSYSALNVQKHI